MSVGHAPPMVASVCSVGQVGTEAKGMPSEVTEQPAMEVVPLPTTGQTELPTAPVVPTVAGVTPSIEALPMQAEVAAAGTRGT